MHADPRLVGGVLIGMVDPAGLRWADARAREAVGEAGDDVDRILSVVRGPAA